VPYEAISYAWESREKPHSIRIRNIGDVRITKSLFDILRHFRYVHRSRIRWVDAICIDQRNVSEKNLQVAKMADIFSASTTVLIWLGAGEETDALAFATMEVCKRMEASDSRGDPGEDHGDDPGDDTLDLETLRYAWVSHSELLWAQEADDSLHWYPFREASCIQRFGTHRVDRLKTMTQNCFHSLQTIEPLPNNSIQNPLRQENDIIHRRRLIPVRVAHNLQLLALLDLHASESDTRSSLAVNVESGSFAENVLEIAVPCAHLRVVQPQFPSRVADRLVVVDDRNIVDAAVKGDGGGSRADGGVVGGDDCPA
jgi:hypothetical protein